MAPIALGVRGLGVGRLDSGVWTPALLLPVSGLLPEHWYRSDQGLWQDAGITPAVSDGDVVGRWEDITANNDHVNQAAAASKPTLQNGAGDLLNGHPVVRFDGANDYLQGAYTTGGALAQPFMVFVVAALDAGAVDDGSQHRITAGDDAGNNAILYQRPGAGADTWSIYAGAVMNDGASDAAWNIWAALFNGVASQLWLDGVSAVGPGDAGAQTPDGLTIGSDFSGLNVWDGDMAEIIIYEANLSNADKNTVGQYLATRYGLAYTDI